MREVVLDVINHKDLAADQEECWDVLSHRAGRGPQAVVMEDVDFGGVTLFCKTSATGQARPMIPKDWRKKIMSLYHQLAHSGAKECVKKITDKYY